MPTTISSVSELVRSLLRGNKQELFDNAGPGRLQQTGAVVISTGFELPTIDASLPQTMPSIEMFVASPSGGITATGTNADLNDAWAPSVERLASIVFEWLDVNDVQLTGDAYVTASITPAADVSGDPHFDDDQFTATDGVGVVAIVAEHGGSRVARRPIDHEDVRPPHPVVVGEALADAFACGEIDQDTFGSGDVIVFPQFGQIHAGPGPVGSADEVRHLLVLRAPTVPQ